MRFEAVIGQSQVKRILISAARQERLPNSYLFTGSDGVGKWAAALALVAYLNCRQRGEDDNCGVCPPCRQIARLQYPNLYVAVPTPPSKSDKEERENYWEILNARIAEPYSLIGGSRQMSIPVETVREMKKSLSQKPPVSGRRVVLIDQMDRMLTSSADALLKLIEEPPSQTLIIVTTSRPDQILPTIISRCRRVRFSRLREVEIREYLTARKGETEKKAHLLARLSSGSLGQALYLAEDENLQDREVAKMVFKGMFDGGAAEVIGEAVDLLPVDDRFRLNRVIVLWQTLFRDLMLLQSGGQEDQIINVDFSVELARLAGRPYPAAALTKIPARLGAAREDIDLNVEPRTAVAAAIMDIAGRLQ